ncbi:Uncharacterised protein [Bordetella ansorpii]|uniref:General secretion pathway protein C n=1 Tax=Bordetella ansorpii TaxID=288768 RepID=A0A157SFH2_9BORD|nr:hypothetical protein [Bordetella ansorpii]SAI69094.1 Uncharacterised protein [Bordetella ansorpii]
MQTLERIDPRALVRLMGLVGVVSAIAVWGYLLFEPLPPAAPPAMATAPAADPSQDKLVQWFVPGPLKIEVQASGLMWSSVRAVAVLSVNGGAPRAYAVGDTLVDSVTVHRIGRDGIEVDKAGEIVRIALPEQPGVAGGGITRVSGAHAAR